jgi:hypothetical protein
MKSALHIVAVLAVAAVVLLGIETSLVLRCRSGVEDLTATNQLQNQANQRLQEEINGFKLSRSKIDVLFNRLSESIFRARTAELTRSPAGDPAARSLLENRETIDQEPLVISRMTEMGVVTQPARAVNGEAALAYLAGSSTLEFSRLVSLFAELENSNPFLYFDRVVVNRPSSVPPFSDQPTYLDGRFFVRILSQK